ncbi:MAG: tyrosine-type recombinase/integrase [Phycisphaerae bacterium]
MRYRLPGESAYRQKNLGCRDKQVAETRLREFVVQAEREAAGIIPPRELVNAAARPLSDHLADFLADQKAAGRAKMYLYNIQKHVERLLADCGWVFPKDVTTESFAAWIRKGPKSTRTGLPLAPKTRNAYLDDASALLNWMSRQGRIAANPLAANRRAKVDDGEEKRRAFISDEVEKVLAVAGDRRACYLLAVTCGLRRNELRQLRWFDVHLDALRPYVRVRASTTKNGKAATLPLREDVAAALRARRDEAGNEAAAPVFGRLVPSMVQFREDLKAAGVDEVDATGRRLVFHSFRHTLATELARAGVSPRVAMEYMRHSDMKLTMRTYTDAERLPTWEAVEQLPAYASVVSALQLRTGTDDAQSDAQNDAKNDAQPAVHGGRRLSSHDVPGEAAGRRKPSPTNEKRHPLAPIVTVGQGVTSSWGSRIRT